MTFKATACEIREKPGMRHRALDNADNDGYRLPLVEGIVPAERASSSDAMRKARPNALKTVSHW